MGAVAPHRRDDGGTLRENRGKAFQRRRHLCNLTEIEGFARFDGGSMEEPGGWALDSRLIPSW
jgi:hypothetical protein